MKVPMDEVPFRVAVQLIVAARTEVRVINLRVTIASDDARRKIAQADMAALLANVALLREARIVSRVWEVHRIVGRQQARIHKDKRVLAAAVAMAVKIVRPQADGESTKGDTCHVEAAALEAPECVVR